MSLVFCGSKFWCHKCQTVQDQPDPKISLQGAVFSYSNVQTEFKKKKVLVRDRAFLKINMFLCFFSNTFSWKACSVGKPSPYIDRLLPFKYVLLPCLWKAYKASQHFRAYLKIFNKPEDNSVTVLPYCERKNSK